MTETETSGIRALGDNQPQARDDEHPLEGGQTDAVDDLQEEGSLADGSPKPTTTSPSGLTHSCRIAPDFPIGSNCTRRRQRSLRFDREPSGYVSRSTLKRS